MSNQQQIPSLTREELELIEESLKYTKAAFQNYQSYPSEEFRQTRIEQVEKAISKIRLLKAITNL